MTAPAPCKPLACGTGIYFGSFAHPLYWELKHLFNICDSRANCTHSARAKVCKLRAQTHFPSQDYISKHLTRWMQSITNWFVVKKALSLQGQATFQRLACWVLN